MHSSHIHTGLNAVKHWYLPLIAGVLLVLLGFDVFTTPVESYLTLSMLFSFMFVLTGLLQMAFALANRRHFHSWGWYFVAGLLSALFGLILLGRPGISIVTLPYIVGFFLLFHSVNAIGSAYDLKRMNISNWGNIAVAGMLGLVFSFILLWNPLFAGLSLVVWTGFSLMAIGIAAILLSLHLRKIKQALRQR